MSEQIIETVEMNQMGHIEYIDILRVLSMLSVVFLHTAAGSLRGNTDTVLWHVANVLTAVMSTSVPIFFMISGAMLLSSRKTLSIGFTYKKRIFKIVIPFLMWSFVAIIYYMVLKKSYFGFMDWETALKRLRNMPSQAAAVHLWFMYALIPLYMLSPILKKLTDGLGKKLALYMVALWVVFSSVLPTVAAFIPVGYGSSVPLNNEYGLDFMSGYLGYFVMGYFLLKFKKRISKKLLAGIIIIDTAVISVGSWWETIAAGEYSETFKQYPKIFILVLSIAIFLFFKEWMAERRLPRRVSGCIQVLSALSFGVYLVHNLLVDFISNKINLWPAHSMYELFLCYFIVLFVSLGCIIVLASCRITCFAFTGLTYKGACQTCNIKKLLKKH